MRRLIGPVLALILFGIVVGFILGLVVGIVVLPVTFTNAQISNLRPEQKEDYVIMVSAAYALDNNLADAKQRLSKLDSDPANAAKTVTALAQRAIDRNDTRNAKNLAALAIALGAGTPALRNYLSPSGTPTPAPVPTFTPTATATRVSLAVETPTSTATAIPPTSTAIPPTSPPTRRPPTATFTPAPPTATATPSVDFKVVKQRMLSIKENGGCFGKNTYFITVIDVNEVPLPDILVRRIFAANVQIPPTGAKGPGKTEETTPRYGGDQLFVFGNTSGARFTSEVTNNLSTNEAEIPIDVLIAGGYCPNPAECQQRIRDNQLCLGHHSYEVVFQRTW